MDKWGVISAVLTMSGLVIALVTTTTTYQQFQADREQVRALEARARVETELAELNEIKKQASLSKAAADQTLRSIEEQLKRSGRSVSITSLAPEERRDLEQIKKNQSDLDARLAKLENAILTSPERAVALPMVKQQLDSLQDRTRSDIEGIRGEIGRLFTLTQWFIGLMFTIALGVFGLSFNLRKPTTLPAVEKQ